MINVKTNKEVLYILIYLNGVRFWTSKEVSL